jgi:predicted nucleic acid-binding protein
VSAAKAAGVALARLKSVDGRITVDALVMATAALLDAVVITGDPDDFERLSVHFPGVVVLSA